MSEYRIAIIILGTMCLHSSYYWLYNNIMHYKEFIYLLQYCTCHVDVATQLHDMCACHIS